MTLDLTCTECEASFEVDVQALLDAPKILACPNCEAKAPTRKVEALAAALDDLTTAMEELAPKFEITVAVESDDLPSKEARVLVSADDDEEGDSEDSDDEEDDEDDEDSELEF